MFMVRMAAGALVAWSALAAGIVPGDARRGEQLFQSERCDQCHSVGGRGGVTTPDLARRVDRNYTPTVMASLMWNHAPGAHPGAVGRPVRLLRLGALLREARRRGAR